MTDKITVYEIITEKIIKMLDEGTVPWRKPWTMATMPRNLVTNRPYTGINVFLLMAEGYDSPYWLTFNQIDKLGGKIKRDENDKALPSTIVIFWKLSESKTEKDENGKPKKFAILRYYRVWNLDQTEGVKVPKRPAEEPREVSPIEAAEAIVNGYPNAPKIVRTGASAVYNWETDTIKVPSLEAHHSDEEHYSTLLHEIVHSTGHKSRLNRPIENSFGSHPYGREELIAEMGAAFLCGEAGISPAVIDNQAAYIASWKRTIKADTKAVVVAAGQAQKAADHVLNRAYAEQQLELEKAA
jgi:antirestriction protein ArdC